MYIKEINKINRPGSLMLPWSAGWPVVMWPRHLCSKGWIHHPLLHYHPSISPFVSCYDGGGELKE